MKVFIVTLVLALASTTAMAERSGGHHGGKKHMARMQQELGLTDEQVAEMRAIRQSGGSQEEVQAVLTEEQQSKAKEFRIEMKAPRGERMSRMQQHLDLSDAQVAQMKEIREQGGSREEIHAVLTQEQQEKLAELRRAHHGGKRKPEA